MNCGQNNPVESNITPTCKVCMKETLLVVVTEANKDRLPIPENLIGKKQIDLNDPSKTCQCKAGTCPCGKFVAHKIGDPCPADEYLKGKKD